ncbi:MAG: proline dehydrogenase family protein [Flavobacteriales bacterium]
MKLSFENTEVAFSHKNNKELKKAYWLFKLVGKPSLVSVGKVMTKIALAVRFPMAWMIKPTIFHQFCGGETISECAQTTKILDDFNIGTILDYSVEGKVEERDFDATANEILDTVRTANNNSHIPFCVFKITGIARFGLLEKMNDSEVLSKNEEAEKERFLTRLDAICKASKESQTPVFIDAEESWIQEAIDDLAEQMMQKYNKDDVWVYNTIQLYRKDKLSYLKAQIEHAKTNNYVLGVKLVRGAYMEKERDRAQDYNYDSPIQDNKASADQDFDLALKTCVENINYCHLVAGTHNEASSLYLTKLIQDHGILSSDKRVYFAQLFGMSDHISFNLAAAGYNVAKYVPYGPIKEVLPYLIRRADENTSVKGQTGRELSLILKEMKRRKGIN